MARHTRSTGIRERKPGFNTTTKSDSAINSLIKGVSSHGGAAKYNTSVAGDIQELEVQAIENGMKRSMLTKQLCTN